MIIQNYTEIERSMLLALVSSPVFKVLEKVINEDREECLNRLASEKSMDEIRRLQGRVEGCQVLKNVPKLLAQYEVDRQAKESKKLKA